MVSPTFCFSVTIDNASLGARKPCAESFQRLLFRTQLTRNYLLVILNNKEHCSFQQNNSIKMAVQHSASVLTGVLVKFDQFKCWDFFPLTCHTAHCTRELKVKLGCFWLDAVYALLVLLLVPALTFTYVDHCCQLYVQSNHTVLRLCPFCTPKTSAGCILKLTVVWVRRIKKNRATHLSRDMQFQKGQSWNTARGDKQTK